MKEFNLEMCCRLAACNFIDMKQRFQRNLRTSNSQIRRKKTNELIENGNNNTECFKKGAPLKNSFSKNVCLHFFITFINQKIRNIKNLMADVLTEVKFRYF